MNKTTFFSLVRETCSNIVRILPVFLAPFSVLFAEAWIHLQIYQYDYQKAVLLTENTEFETEISRLNADVAAHAAVIRLDEKAQFFGLQDPDPQQIFVIPPTYISGEHNARDTAEIAHSNRRSEHDTNEGVTRNG